MLDIKYSLDELMNQIIGVLPKLGLSLGFFFLTLWIASFVAKIIRSPMERRDVDPELILLSQLITKWVIRVLGMVIAVEILAAGTLTSLIAGLGIAGFTIGFALQDVAKNFIAGILLLLQQPFNIGESIEVAGFGGTVLDISLRTTEIRTWDGRNVIIPNADVYVSPIVNFSKAPRRRVEITVGIDYESDLDQVTRTALGAIQKIPGVLEEPAPSVMFKNFGESAIEFSAYCWVDTKEIGLNEATDAGIKEIKDAFAQQDIKIPFPTRTVLSTTI